MFCVSSERGCMRCELSLYRTIIQVESSLICHKRGCGIQKVSNTGDSAGNAEAQHFCFQLIPTLSTLKLSFKECNLLVGTYIKLSKLLLLSQRKKDCNLLRRNLSSFV